MLLRSWITPTVLVRPVGSCQTVDFSQFGLFLAWFFFVCSLISFALGKPQFLGRTNRRCLLSWTPFLGVWRMRWTFASVLATHQVSQISIISFVNFPLVGGMSRRLRHLDISNANFRRCSRMCHISRNEIFVAALVRQHHIDPVPQSVEHGQGFSILAIVLSGMFLVFGPQGNSLAAEHSCLLPLSVVWRLLPPLFTAHPKGLRSQRPLSFVKICCGRLLNSWFSDVRVVASFSAISTMAVVLYRPCVNGRLRGGLNCSSFFTLVTRFLLLPRAKGQLAPIRFGFRLRSFHFLWIAPFGISFPITASSLQDCDFHDHVSFHNNGHFLVAFLGTLLIPTSGSQLALQDHSSLLIFPLSHPSMTCQKPFMFGARILRLRLRHVWVNLLPKLTTAFAGGANSRNLFVVGTTRWLWNPAGKANTLKFVDFLIELCPDGSNSFGVCSLISMQ